jgi:hypothetical protein
MATSRDMASARRIAAPSLGIFGASPGATPSSVLTNGGAIRAVAMVAETLKKKKNPAHEVAGLSS